MYYNKVEICGVNTSRLKTLTDEEKRELLVKTKAGNEEARQELIYGNLRLVLSIIQRFGNRKENMDDLFQVGCIGLVKAVDNFNIELDVKFSTYAVPMNIECRNHERSFYIMTRKQAILKAIQALSALEGKEEAITLLQDIYDEMPLIHWSDKSIRDTVEQFIVDNGRIPNVSDFKKKGMPPHTIFQQKYKITLGEWLQQNYPTPAPTFEELKDKYTKEFIEEYIRIKPTSEEDFNKQRKRNAKTWNTVAKYHNTNSWLSLLQTLSLPSYNKSTNSKNRTVMKVYISSDIDFYTSNLKC